MSTPKARGQNQTIAAGYKAIAWSCKRSVFPRLFRCLPLGCRTRIGESTVVKQAINEERLSITDVLLGDETFGGADLTELYAKSGCWLLTPKQLPPHNRTWKDDLYEYRKETIELLFQRIIQTADLKSCQVKGNGKNGAFVLANVWLYQIIFLMNLRQQKPLANVKE